MFYCMAAVKNPDHAIRYLAMSKRMARGSLSRALNIELKARALDGEQPRASPHLLSLGLAEPQVTALVSRDYWKFHDINSNNVVNRVWVQSGNRQTHYALSSAKACFKHAPLSTTSKAAFNCLVRNDHILHYLFMQTSPHTNYNNDYIGETV